MKRCGSKTQTAVSGDPCVGRPLVGWRSARGGALGCVGRTPGEDEVSGVRAMPEESDEGEAGKSQDSQGAAALWLHHPHLLIN